MPNPGLAQPPHAASTAVTAAMAAAPARVSKPCPQLSSFKSLESLYEVVTHGDPTSGMLSFSAMAQVDPLWHKGLCRHYFELDSAVREMTERAEAESKKTGQDMSPRKHAKLMDAERVQDGKTRASGRQHLWLHG